MSKLPSILLYLGPEDGLRAEELDALRSRVRKESGAAADEHRVYLPDGSVPDAVDLLVNGSLFATHRLVIVIGAEQIRTKDDVAAIASYCASPPSDATLVLVSDAVRLDAKLEKVVPPDARKVFWELFDNQKRGWVISYFRKRGVAISADAVELFLELVENDTRELRLEADKLCVYVEARKEAPGRSEVSVEDVETFIYHSRDENVFTLYKSIVEDDFALALEIAEKLDASGESAPVQLIGGLVFQVRKLVALRSLLDGGFSAEEAFKRLAVRGKRIQSDYSAAAARFDLVELQRQLHVLIDYDVAFRELGTGLQRVLLDLLVYQLMFRSDALAVHEAVS